MKKYYRLLFAAVLLILAGVCLSGCQESNESKYNKAQELLSKGKYEEAVKAFDEISTYEDSSKLSMYAKAIQTAETGDYETAIRGFEKLGDFKDCSMMITYYTARMYESRANEENWSNWINAANIYDEILLFLDGKEHAENCRKSAYDEAVDLFDKKVYLTSHDIFAALNDYADSKQFVLYIEAITYEQSDLYVKASDIYKELGEFKDSQEQAEAVLWRGYQQAEALENEGKQNEASFMFLSLGDYSNSYERAYKPYYDLGIVKREEQDWDAAVDAFTKASDYSDASDQILATRYAEGEAKRAAQEWDAAVDAFAKAGDYSDAADQILATRYAEGEVRREEQDWAGAVSAFGKAGDYRDAATQVAVTLYTEGTVKREAKDWDGAVKVFKSIEGFRDVQEQILRTYYEQGCAYLESGDIENAIVAFEKSDDYSDAADKIKEIFYKKGLDFLAQSDWIDAEKAFQRAGDYSNAAGLRNEAVYQQAGQLFEYGDYKRAKEAYETIKDYKDSEEIISKITGNNLDQYYIIKQQSSSNLVISTTVYDGSKKVADYHRNVNDTIHMPIGDNYSPLLDGVLTFRGSAFRQNAFAGTVETPVSLELLWTAKADSSRGASQLFYGYEWTNQPAIVKWSSRVRESSNINEEKRSKTDLKEVIIAGVDGVIRFLDLDDGVETRSIINLGYPMKGTPSLHPAGYPYMNVGQYIRKMKTKTGTIGLRQYNLYNQKEMKLIDGLDGKLHRGINRIGSFETSALIDRTSDTMITLGTNGLLYLTRMNTNVDEQTATLSMDMETVVMSSRGKGEKSDALVAVESSHAMYDHYVFYADMGGILRCVDTDTLMPLWAAETDDAVMAAVALDMNQSGGLDLYTANMLENRAKGNALIRRYDALTGEETWTVEVGVSKEKKSKEDVGVKASPVIGQNGLNDLVYFTVTGLNDEGRKTLGLAYDTSAALVALKKENGEIYWVKGLSDRSESSPVAVYNGEGEGWIIQCAEDGMILLLEGRTGKIVADLRVEGNIEASPAVYGNIMVIGTTGKGTERVYGIHLGSK